VNSLKEAGLERCDVLVAATGDDEDNLVVSLLAKQEFAVPRVIARVNHPRTTGSSTRAGHRHLSEHAAPHHRAVGEAVSVGRLVRLFQLEGGAVALVEVTLADDAPVAQQAVRDIDIPRDATIVAIVRDDHVIMPRGDTMLLPGDEVLALVTTEAEDQLRTMLTGA